MYVHKLYLAAQKVFHEHKIANLIDEGLSSHINQPFDWHLARNPLIRGRRWRIA
jgi:hypothetical protein